MKNFLGLLLVAIMTATAQAAEDLTGDTLNCGGSADSEKLVFSYNPVSQMYSATTADFNFWVYIRPLKNARVDVALTRSIEPAVRNKVMKYMKEIGVGDLAYVAQADTQSFTVGLVDNYVHFFFQQGPRVITFSCLKK